MRVELVAATPGDSVTVAAIRNAAAEHLASTFGIGHWSATITDKSVRQQMKYGSVFLVLKQTRPVATLTLSTKKPWSHDRKYFTACKSPRFLTGMAVEPSTQRKGLGRACLESAKAVARGFGCDAICLDAYDHAAGAGEFYRKCGCKEVGRVSYRGTPLIYFEMLL